MDVTIEFEKSTDLCEIMGRHKSDKGHRDIINSWHNYTTFYNVIFSPIKDKAIRLFELGIGTNNINLPSNMGVNGIPGASLYGWEEFFPNAQVFGADIDSDILFQTDRIKTFFCDQTKPRIIEEMWNKPELSDDFDIIIEDGLHSFAANVCFLENSIHKVKPGGYYIIEDITVDEKHLFEAKIKEWEDTFVNFSFNLRCLPSRNIYDNNLLVVYRHS
jgi:SAM-dependent methyltransferase